MLPEPKISSLSASTGLKRSISAYRRQHHHCQGYRCCSGFIRCSGRSRPPIDGLMGQYRGWTASSLLAISNSGETMAGYVGRGESPD